MPYVDEISGARRYFHAFYVKFDGIAERFCDIHPDKVSAWSPSGTFLECMVRDSLSGGGQSLDRQTGIIKPAGFSFTLNDTSATRAIFRRRGGTEDALAAGVNPGTTAIALKSGTNAFADGTTLHVGRETFTLGTHTVSGVYSGSVRGELDTVAAHHPAGFTVSTVPRHWRGRRVQLITVDLNSGEEKTIRTGVLDDYPAQQNGVRIFEVIDLMTVLNKPILTGWEEQRIEGTYPRSTIFDFHPSGVDLPGALEFKVEDGRQIAEDGYVMFTVSDGTFITPILDNQPNLSDGRFVVAWAKLAGSSNLTTAQVLEESNITVRQVEVVDGRLAVVALQVMQSILGDFANGTYDTLPGRKPNDSLSTTDLVRKRGGAGIPSAWIDESAFEFIPGGATKVLLDEEVRLFDFLRDEIMWRADGYIYVNGSGQLSFQRYQPLTIRGSLPSVTEDEVAIGPVKATDSEAHQVGAIEIECNYIPGEGYTRRLPVVFREAAEIYDLDADTRVTLQSKSVWVGRIPEQQTQARQIAGDTVRSRLERYRASGLDGGLRLPLRFPWAKSATMVEGHRFALTDSRITDSDGTKGITSKPFEVVGTRPDYGAGHWDVEVEEIQTGQRIGFSGVVDSYASNTITLKDTGVHGDGALFDDNPAEDLGAGWVVRIHDFSATPPYSTSTTETVLSVSGNDIVLDTPASTPANLDIVVLEDSDEDLTTANAAGADVQDYAFGADASDRIGTSTWERAANKWR